MSKVVGVGSGIVFMIAGFILIVKGVYDFFNDKNILFHDSICVVQLLFGLLIIIKSINLIALALS